MGGPHKKLSNIATLQCPLTTHFGVSFVIDAVERQTARKKIMKDYCLTHSYVTKPSISRQSLGYIIVDDEHKIIYCTIPKVGTSTWKKVLADLRGLKGEVKVHMRTYIL